MRKSIYGLKQDTELNKQIKKMGFNQSNSDPIYVDDIILAGENTGNIDDAKKIISEKFDVKW